MDIEIDTIIQCTSLVLVLVMVNRNKYFNIFGINLFALLFKLDYKKKRIMFTTHFYLLVEIYKCLTKFKCNSHNIVKSMLISTNSGKYIEMCVLESM